MKKRSSFRWDILLLVVLIIIAIGLKACGSSSADSADSAANTSVAETTAVDSSASTDAATADTDSKQGFFSRLWFGKSCDNSSDASSETVSSTDTSSTDTAGSNTADANGFTYRYPADQYDETFYTNVPILMYHVVEDGPNSLYLKPEDFQAQLDYFEANGIHPITMKELYSHWVNWTPLPKKPIVLSFDDGYRSMYTEAYPRLKAKGYPGVFYIYTAAIGQDTNLTEAMIKEMSDNGMEIGSHTVNHLDLSGLTSDEVRSEFADSKSMLETITGQEVVSLCYPSGSYTDSVQQVAAETGYLTAVTTEHGVAASTGNHYTLPRLRVSLGDGAAAIESKLAVMSNYTW